MEENTEDTKGSKNTMYLWQGFHDIKPRSFQTFSELSIHQVAVGAGHCAFLTTQGQLYTLGNNKYGQLGVGTYDSCLNEPLHVEALSGEVICNISCGERHSAAISVEGNIYCWGDSTEGQCGIEGIDITPTPIAVVITDNHPPCGHGHHTKDQHLRMLQIACGSTHTLALSEYGEIWVWGSGIQLGIQQVLTVSVPRKLEFLSGRRVLRVASGRKHSLALVQKCSRDAGRDPQSPITNGIQQHRLRPSTCVKCKEEIYTYTETADSCIIESSHKCPLGLVVSENSKKLSDRRKHVPQPLRLPGEIPNGRSSLSKKNLAQKPSSNGSIVAMKDGDPKRTDQATESAALKKSTSKPEGNVGDGSVSKGSMADVERIKEVLREQKESKPTPNLTSESLPTQTNGVSSGSANASATSDSVDKGAGTSAERNSGTSDYNAESNVATVDPSSVGPQDELDVNVRREVVSDTDVHVWYPTDTSNKSKTKHHMDITPLNSLTDSIPGLPKSKSSFLDESQAKEFLQKQLSGTVEEVYTIKSPPPRQLSTSSQKSSTSSPPSSPFVKKMENILQIVSTPPAAMQEYVSNLTKTVVTNIKTSMDKFGLASGVLDDGSEGDSENSQGETKLEGDGRISGSFAEEENLGTFERYGTLPKSKSLGPGMQKKAAKKIHSRKTSLPSGALEKLNDVHLEGWLGEEMNVDTEVWSWGHGGQGQLGHGDLLDRFQPCVVTALSDKRVVKLVCGDLHSLALTANSKLFCWGSNSHNQLASSEQVLTSPTLTTVQGGAAVWDVAAGDMHSLVLCDCAGFCPDVFYSGRSPSIEEDSPFHKTNQFTRIGVIRKVQRGWLSQVVSGGSLCGCVIQPQDCELIAALYEFAVTERAFYSQLDIVLTTFLKPLLQEENFRSLEGTDLGASLVMLTNSLCHLADSVAINHLQLTRVIAGRLTWDKLNLLVRSSKNLSNFQQYSKSFSDILATGGFDQCVKQAKSFFDKVQGRFVLIMEERSIDCTAVGTTFKKVLQVPFRRPKEYSKLLNKMALRFPSFSGEHASLTQISHQWDGLRQRMSADHLLAENTQTFWMNDGLKFTHSLRSPSRRLLRDSKTCPISLHAAKRFSSQVFLLFNDIFVHIQYSSPQVYPLVTVWIEPASDIKNSIVLVTPEDSLTLVTMTASQKGEWLWAINQATNEVLTEKRNLTTATPISPNKVITPPNDRQADHIFMKPGPYKDAKYQGMWRKGKMHGHGVLEWADGRRYVGSFKDGSPEGIGAMTTPGAEGQELYEGHWRQGKPHGLGTMLYPNGDQYKGNFSEGKRCGHGVFKQGKFTSESRLASIYVGEWMNDKRHGYAVHEDITKGEKYMGMWLDDCRHGNGIIVTLDGVYFEGNFAYNKIMGTGLLMTEDNTFYEGQFSGATALHGKGTLTLPNGDFIEGNFSGSFSDGVKVTGTFHKLSQPLAEHKGFTHAMGLVPPSFGKLSVVADRKWLDIFEHCYTMLGCTDTDTDKPAANSRRAWEKVAAILAVARKLPADVSSSKRSTRPDDLELIPQLNTGNLTLEQYHKIQHYLQKALDRSEHPLGMLVDCLVDVYRASYVGVGAHPRLLHHAVQELKCYVSQIYHIFRILFPDLPEGSDAQLVFSEKQTDGQTDDDQCEVVSGTGLVHTLLLPKIYPPLFTLYALYNEKDDDKYWRRVRHWNKQPDVSLMSYLGVDQMFWLIEESENSKQRISVLRDRSYVDAIDTLQRMSTSFSPAEKLSLIQQTFTEVNKLVQARMQADYLWSMDDLFPVFLYVVVRARIQHLGAEIHFIDDLMERHLEFGELGIMFTTLKACYFQIQQEKLV